MLIGSYTEAYTLLRGYCSDFGRVNGNSDLVYFESNTNHQFVRCHLMIPGSWKLVQHCGKRVMLDATFLTGRFKGTLHIAATLDANNEISILAFSIGGNESESTWRHFLQFFKSRFGFIHLMKGL